MQLRKCTMCKREKPVDQYRVDDCRGRPYGACRMCRNKKARERTVQKRVARNAAKEALKEMDPITRLAHCQPWRLDDGA